MNDASTHPRRVRTAARAVIIENAALLVVEYRDSEGPWYLLPGGGQDHEETLEACLRREVHEELGVQVQVGEMLHVREFISSHNPASHLGPGFHQLEVIFAATLVPGVRPHMPASADRLQTGIAWLPLAELHRHRLQPAALRSLLVEGGAGYLGAL